MRGRLCRSYTRTALGWVSSGMGVLLSWLELVEKLAEPWIAWGELD